MSQLGTVVPSCHLGTQEAEAGGSPQVGSPPGLPCNFEANLACIRKPCLKIAMGKKPQNWPHRPESLSSFRLQCQVRCPSVATLTNTVMVDEPEGRSVRRSRPAWKIQDCRVSVQCAAELWPCRGGERFIGLRLRREGTCWAAAIKLQWGRIKSQLIQRGV